MFIQNSYAETSWETFTIKTKLKIGG